MSTDKTWKDQPDAVLTATPLASIYIDGRIMEVRDEEDSLLLTVGSLFGSETLRFKDPRQLIKTIGLASNLKDGAMLNLPKGAVLVKGSES